MIAGKPQSGLEVAEALAERTKAASNRGRQLHRVAPQLSAVVGDRASHRTYLHETQEQSVIEVGQELAAFDLRIGGSAERVNADRSLFS